MSSLESVPTQPYETVSRRGSNPARFALMSGLTLLRVNHEVDIYKPVYAEIAQSEKVEPLNRQEEITHEFNRILDERDLVIPSGKLQPYWDAGKDYKPLEVFGTLIQFMDYHREDLPTTTLPPEKDVKAYIDHVMATPERVMVPQQFEALLDITGNDLLGATNLGAIASRVMARGLETRAYPNISAKEADMKAWNEKVAQFELDVDRNKNDGPGDTYYFWTHVFGGLYFNQFEGMGHRTYRSSFANGTEIMAMARQWVARSPINSEHHEASIMGRHIAETLKGHIDVKELERTGVRTGRVERFLQDHARLLHYLDDVMPDGTKERARKFLRQEAFPLKRPFTKTINGVSAQFWVKNASDWHRIVQENEGDSFPSELIGSIQKGDTFLDVGSAQGIYSILAAKAGAEVYAADPDPISVASAKENLEVNPEVGDAVNMLTMGLGDKEGFLELNYDTAGTYAPSLQRTTKGLSQQVRVPVRTVDNLISEGVIKPPNVVKIDVEGAEGMVLDGMKELFVSDKKPRHLFVEVHGLYLPKFGSSSAEILQKIADMGYVPYGDSGKERGKSVYHFVPQEEE